MRRVCEVRRLGLVPYLQAWRLQERLAEEIAAARCFPTLLLLEHPHTFTFGRRGRAENLLWDEEERTRRGIEVHWVDRGGDVTYHGPGQLVGYPLLPLAPVSFTAGDHGLVSPRIPQADYIGYVRRLEQALILALAGLGAAGFQRDGLTGVWVYSHPAAGRAGSLSESSRGPAKIASIGVKVDARGVSRHGFALNVAPDMSYWQGIVGCGLKDALAASLADFGEVSPGMAAVMDCVVWAFGEVFGFEMVENSERMA